MVKLLKLLVLLIVAVEHSSSWSIHHLSMDAIALTRTGRYLTSCRGCYRRHRRTTSSRLHFDATTTIALESASVAGGLYLLLQLVVYWRMQFVAAGLVGGIPTGSNIVELDAVDGKNVFYLPKDSFYTAIMTSGDKVDNDASKQMERQRMNEQLILESIGKANRDNGSIQGKIRSRTQDVPNRSSDCVVSVGAMKRSSQKDAQNPNNAKVELINEAYRMLRPGGLFVFLEPDDDRNLIDLVYKVFPRSIAPAPASSRGTGDEARGRQQRKTERTALILDSDKDIDTAALDSSQTVVTVDSRRGKRSSRAPSSSSSSFDRSTSRSVEGIGMVVGDALVVDSDASLSGGIEGSAGEDNRETNSRPGVSFQAISTLGLFPYVAGIAVKP